MTLIALCPCRQRLVHDCQQHTATATPNSILPCSQHLPHGSTAAPSIPGGHSASGATHQQPLHSLPTPLHLPHPEAASAAQTVSGCAGQSCAAAKSFRCTQGSTAGSGTARLAGVGGCTSCGSVSSVAQGSGLKACPGLQALLKNMPVKHHRQQQQQQQQQGQQLLRVSGA
jgi:hypothetical protein